MQTYNSKLNTLFITNLTTGEKTDYQVTQAALGIESTVYFLEIIAKCPEEEIFFNIKNLPISQLGDENLKIDDSNGDNWHAGLEGGPQLENNQMEFERFIQGRVNIKWNANFKIADFSYEMKFYGECKFEVN